VFYSVVPAAPETSIVQASSLPTPRQKLARV
jgi:hypothetical protein